MAEWIATEMAGLDLRDQRLNDRQCLLLERFSANPQGSIPESLQGWAETQAAYRFFDTKKVTAESVLAPHRQATLERIRQNGVVLVLQDTTELELDRSPEGGFGKLTYESRIGLMDHTRLAITPDGLCLGVTGCDIWARPIENPHAGTRNEERAIEDKESLRWLTGYRDANEIAKEAPQTMIVSIADRESDIYECFLETPEPAVGQSAHWITRAAQNRRLRPQKDDDSQEKKLRTALADLPVKAQRVVRIGARANQPAREASVEIRAGRITLRAPDRKDQKLPNKTVHVVWVREPHPPEGSEPVDWVLLTSLPVETTADVLRVVDWYAARWWIEIYFRTYKQGCQVERLQLQTVDRVTPALALYKIVAWRLQYVTMLGRECPHVSCETVFAPAEWRCSWPIATGHPAPATPPTLGEFLRQVARLGGYLGRKHDGPPGPEVMWRGLRRVYDFSLAWATYNAMEGKTCV